MAPEISRVYQTVTTDVKIKIFQNFKHVCVIREVFCETFPLNADLNPIRHLLALVGARHVVHVSRIRVKAQNQFAQWQLNTLVVTIRRGTMHTQ